MEQTKASSLIDMANGAIKERLDYEMGRVIQNISDPNTKATAKRTITVKIKYGSIYGDVPQAERGGIVDDFQQNPETKVFVAQIQTAGLGITLHAASAAVFYSMDYNYANYAQALARIHRIGQRSPVTYIHLLVEDSIDDKVLAALEKKEDIAKTIVDSWRTYF